MDSILKGIWNRKIPFSTFSLIILALIPERDWREISLWSDYVPSKQLDSVAGFYYERGSFFFSRYFRRSQQPFVPCLSRTRARSSGVVEGNLWETPFLLAAEQFAVIAARYALPYVGQRTVNIDCTLLDRMRKKCDCIDGEGIKNERKRKEGELNY